MLELGQIFRFMIHLGLYKQMFQSCSACGQVYYEKGSGNSLLNSLFYGAALLFPLEKL